MSKFRDFCTNTDLHATVILPGACNAKCKFCEYNKGKIKININAKIINIRSK